ncbi:hypothetical protein [Lacisediminimonas sp.]|uniref:hypothetical protein n=1 Tax=Lacisediminimonas sp. TaxID=3060582 RepID=UPI00271BD890|nr:hypothetical protein [Lacisediminimonas sp.]MDO8299215.1 hypothetical protein [Lacisediminimonas sp.]MDO9217257.1 hypothetical protein [Lacisediminimonas sp.]
MFKRKNLLLTVAAPVALSLMLAACGGSDDAPATSSGGTSTPAGTDTTPVLDQTVLSGFLRLTGNQLMFSNTIITSEQFATIPEGAGPFTKGTNAPLIQFGLRISPVGMETTAGQSATGRLAIEMKERVASAPVGEDEQFQVMLDKLTVSASPAGGFSVADATGAKAYIYYKPATGAAINITLDNAAGLVRLDPVLGDPTSNMLVFDLETAVTRALAAATGATATTLGGLKNVAGLFDMRATVSNLTMRAGDEITPLVGAPITVTNSGQVAVTGAGVAGAVQVE